MRFIRVPDMLKSFLFILLIISPLINFSQDKFSKVPLGMRNKPWLDKEDHFFYGYTIHQVFGSDKIIYRHSNVGQFTTLTYQDLDKILESLDSIAFKEFWSEDELNQKKEHYRNNAPGGRFMIFISRYNESDANTRWYFVILRDLEDVKFYEKQLEYQSPELPEGIGWWNYYEFLIDVPVEFPFYIYLNDKTSNHLSDFKFMISKTIPE